MCSVIGQGEGKSLSGLNPGPRVTYLYIELVGPQSWACLGLNLFSEAGELGGPSPKMALFSKTGLL